MSVNGRMEDDIGSDAANDKFREEFRACKKLTLNDIDVNTFNDGLLNSEQAVPIKSQPLCANRCYSYGLVPSNKWQMYKFKEIPGFYFLRNPFYRAACWYWIYRALVDFTKYPLKSNLTTEGLVDSHKYPFEHFKVLSAEQQKLREKKQPLERLRWTTLGYQYNWATKKYYSDHYVPFPSDLREMTSLIVKALNLGDEYNPETAIVNFYPEGSTLGIHVDNKELESNSPLVSVSLAHTAVFLLGDSDRLKQPIKFLLRSGDVMVMSESCRQRYHAVPKIFVTDSFTREDLHASFEEYEQQKESALQECQCDLIKSPKRSKSSDDSNVGCDKHVIGLHKIEEHEVDKLCCYINTRRINLNVRQVKKKGEQFPSSDTDPRLLGAT